MKILAVDTSSKNCSVSIVEVDENENFEIIAQDNNDDERTHSVKLMPMIDNMFKSSNLSLDNIDLLTSYKEKRFEFLSKIVDSIDGTTGNKIMLQVKDMLNKERRG